MNEGLQAARTALAGRPAWLVGGVLRDRALGRCTADVDLVVDGDPAEAAHAVARAAGRAACFALSEDFGAWRVAARDCTWQVDVQPLRGGSLAADLAMRDFTVNAIAEPIEGGAPIDPLGGLADLAARRLRMAAPSAFAEDPLRVLRLVRLAVELELVPEGETLRGARAQAGALEGCSPERVFMELRRIVAAPRALRGLQLMGELRATAVVLPELDALRGVEQSRFHHSDVYGHTLEVLERTIELTAAGSRDGPDPGAVLGEHRTEVAALLAEPLANELVRGDALRWGALLHDAAKPLTRAVRPADGRVTFIGHDSRGAQLARAVLERLRCSERLRAHVAALVRHHLRMGFLVHEPQPCRAGRCSATCAPAPRSRSTSRCCPSPIAWPRAGIVRRSRSTRTCASREGCSQTRCAGAQAVRLRRSCAGTIWPPSSASPRGRGWGSCWRSSPRRSTRAMSARASRRSPTHTSTR
jgi:poly(A) polymerase